MWNEISIKQYYELMDVIQNEKDPIVANAELIRIIFNKNIEDMPYINLKLYLDQLDFLKEVYEPKKPQKSYTIKGIVFKPVFDVKNITTAQYIDYQNYLKISDFKHLLNCLIIRDGEKYGESDYSDLLWENMKFSDYSDVMFFFLILWKELMKSTLSYSIQEMKKELKKEKNLGKRVVLLRKIIKLQEVISRVNEDE